MWKLHEFKVYSFIENTTVFIIYVLFVSASALPQQNWVVAREIQWCFTGVWQPVLQSTLTNIIFLGSILTVCNIGEADSL